MKGTAYLLQATLISLWWIGLLINQEFYDAFQFPGIGETAFNAHMLPDLLVVALLSVLRAYLGRRELGYIILGGFGFATLYCINATLLTGGGYLSSIVMFLGLLFNIFLIYGDSIFRESTTSSVFWNGVKTFLQISCVWIITLYVFPMIILKAFNQSIPEPSSFSPISIILFLAFSLIGILSSYHMVKHGSGTPLPIDQSQELVTSGPYQFVRNPMAISGIGQGLSVGLMLSSIHIFIYAFVGALIWHFIIKPIEEKDMKKRFGTAYENYKEKVNCWIPKIKRT